MSVRRYLVNLAYIGTSFRGSQRQVKGGTPRAEDPSTVQGLLEMGLKYINYDKDTIVFMASRTDAGVHALNTTCHFDLQRSSERILQPDVLIHGLNKFLVKQEVPIRILNAKIVPDDFHCRQNAKSRTYLYRLIVGKQDGEKLSSFMHFVPIEELSRSFFCCNNNFSIDAMREAAALFEGYHDFRTFMGKTLDSDRLTRKEIHSIKIIERRKQDIGVSTDFSWPTIAINNDVPESHLIVDIYFKGKGFLYKQIRRTGAALLSAATGKISLREIRCMLEVPSKHSWNPSLRTLPGYGLYLCEIEY